MLKAWWKLWEGRLEYELEALRAQNIPARLDEAAFAQGIVKIYFDYTTEGVTHPMFAIFSDLYPYCRFEIYAPTLALPYHQNPIAKNLCLIARDTAKWKPTDTLAEFITNRLKDVISAGTTADRDEASTLEAHQAEPYSAYYGYTRESIILVDSQWSLDPALPSGELVIGLEAGTHNFEAPVRGAVLEIHGVNGTLIAEAPPEWRELYPSTVRGRWMRLKMPPATTDAAAILAAVKQEHPRADFVRQRVQSLRVGIIGLVFPEEVARRELGTGWVFLTGKEDKWHTKMKPSLVRAGRAGRHDLDRRRGDVGDTLPKSTIVMIGLGGLGAPAALEFARAGVGALHLVDSDIVEPGTIVRWPLGFLYAGLAKVNALKEFIEAHYPYTKITVHEQLLGAAPHRLRPDIAVMEEVLEGANLIFDATAELGLQYFLSEVARSRNIPYVAVSTTFGAWGGLVARIRPAKAAGCWWCLQHGLESKLIPEPPADPDGTVQPAGCAAPTYTGAGFDATLISLGAVRLAISALIGPTVAAQQVDWDVAVISLRDPAGRVIAPTWWTGVIPPHPECPRPH